MANPTSKAPAIEHFLNDMFGRTSAITSDVCVFCAGDASTFKDDLSEKEYRISGLCQKCQDETFG